MHPFVHCCPLGGLALFSEKPRRDEGLRKRGKLPLPLYRIVDVSWSVAWSNAINDRRSWSTELSGYCFPWSVKGPNGRGGLLRQQG